MRLTSALPKTLLLEIKGSLNAFWLVYVYGYRHSSRTAAIFLTDQIVFPNPSVLDAVFTLGVVADPPVPLMVASDVDETLSTPDIGLGRAMPSAGSQIDRDLFTRCAAGANAVVGAGYDGRSNRMMGRAVSMNMDAPPAVAVRVDMAAGGGRGNHNGALGVNDRLWC